MTRTFTSEDARKEQLFTAWIDYLYEVHSQCDLSEFEEFYEGTATVSDLSRNRLGVHLDDGRKIRHIPITEQISSRSCRLDGVYIVLGRKAGRWWPLDVLSIGSIVPGKQQGVHITYNPLYVNGAQASAAVH